jgi:transposase InsO family protein
MEGEVLGLNDDEDDPKRAAPSQERWAHLRFSIVGRLLAAPPARGTLKAVLEELAREQWRHPTKREAVRFSVSTIEHWYYAARKVGDPVVALRRKLRCDSGQHPSLGAPLRHELLRQYAQHPGWSYQLHFDNLKALVEANSSLGSMPSYPTLRRFMRDNGMFRKRRPRGKDKPGLTRALARLESREVRSWESEYVNALWHYDFHEGSLPVLTPQGEWKKPQLLGILDDYSRVAPHLQWYLSESAENLVHGLVQGFAKRGLPRSALSDNGGAMTAGETVQGLERLGIVLHTTLPYSPYQNGKQESFWGQIEGRLLPMLERVRDLTLEQLNHATQAWVEMEYHRKVHDEIGQSPLQRFLEGKNVGRDCPETLVLRQAFAVQEHRTQRRSDGTVSIEGARFEIPSRLRHIQRLMVRYASWDLSQVWLVDRQTGKVVARIYPLDKKRNADAARRSLEPVYDVALPPAPEQSSAAPLLAKLMADYAATGLPPAYMPKTQPEPDEEN